MPAENSLTAYVARFITDTTAARMMGLNLEQTRRALGNPWTFSFPGVSIKPHPSGSLTHPGMGKMLDIIREFDTRPEQVAKKK